MKKRKEFTNTFIASLVASTIAHAVAIPITLEFWLPVVRPSYGWLVAGAGVFAVPFVLFLVVFLPLIYFLNKSR